MAQKKGAKPKLSLGTIPPPPSERPTLTPAQEAFGRGQAPKRLDAQEPKHRAWERFTLYLPPDVAKALRHRAVDEGQDMSDVTAAALRKVLGVGPG